MPGTTPGAFASMWAFVADEGDREGVCATILPTLGATPLVTGDQRIVERYRALAKEIARLSGRPIRLVRFDRAAEEPL